MRQTVPNLPSATAVVRTQADNPLTMPVPEKAADKPVELVSKAQWSYMIGLIADGVKAPEAVLAAGIARYTLEGILRTDPKRKEQWQDAKLSAIRRLWDMDVLEDIFTAIAGGKLVKEALADCGRQPHEFYKLVLNDVVAKDQYEAALQMQCEGMADEIIEISDDTANDQYLDNNGGLRVNNEVVNRSRLKVDTRKWKMATLHSKRFGTKTQSDSTVNVIIDHAARLEEARARARHRDKVVAVQDKE